MGTRRRRGIVLLLVLVVITILGLATLEFADLMLNERKAAQASGRQARARALAQSGVEVARQFLDRDAADQTEAGGLYDNSARFSAVLVADDTTPQDRGRFSVVAPRIEDRAATGVRYGLQDESARINLATILQADQQAKNGAKTILMALPGMTDDIADAILDWIDADSTPREQGAESEYYGTLVPAYAPRNGPPVTIEELLLVRGVTPQLLFGSDAGRMGLISGTSSDEPIPGVDNSDGSMDHGWAAYLTLHSAESNLKSDGSTKINLNDSDLEKLYHAMEKVLDKPSATFIVAFRLGGKLELTTSREPDFAKLGKASNLKSVLDLIGAPPAQGTFPPPPPPPGNTMPIHNPFTSDTAAMNNYLPKLLDNTTVYSGESIPGRININQAPRAVLMCIPGMTSDIVDQIIAKRVPDPVLAPPDQHYPTWPLTEGIVPLKTMKDLLPFVPAGGSVYRAQVLGTFDQGSSAARLEVILDATKRPTRVLFWKDRSGLPGGFPVEPPRDGTASR